MIHLKEQQKLIITDSIGILHFYDLIHTPPLRVHQIQTDSKNSLKTLKYDPISNCLFTCCYHDGRIYCYDLGGNMRETMEITKKFSISSMQFCRELEVMPDLGLLFVGYVGGFVYIYDLENVKTPMCKFYYQCANLI